MPVRREHLAAAFSALALGGAGTLLASLAATAATGTAVVDPLTAAAVGNILQGAAGSLLANGSSATCRRLFGQQGALDGDLRKALRRALACATAEVAANWWKTEQGQALKARRPDLIPAVETTFADLQDEAAEYPAPVVIAEADGEALSRLLLDLNDAVSADELARRVRGWLGVDPADDRYRVIDYVAANLPPAFRYQFSQELKTNHPAWRALQLLLAEDSRAAFRSLDEGQRRAVQKLLEIEARLAAWESRLIAAAAQPATLRDLADQRALEDALQSAITAAQREIIGAISTKIDDSTRRVIDIAEQARAELRAGFQSVHEELQHLETTHHLKRHWLRPVAPRPELGTLFLGRDTDREAVETLLAPGARAAITAAVHGMPGVGKTSLARDLAYDPPGRFTAGVLFETLGPTFRDPVLVEPILARWGIHAYGRIELPAGFRPSAAAVRTLLAGHGPLLVVLDDVWDRAAIEPLNEALPPEAALLLTTRHEALAADLAERVHKLDLLPKPAAVELLRRRARHAQAHQEPILADLAEALDRHALALDLAGRRLAGLPPAGWRTFADQVAANVREGTVFDDLSVPDEQRERSVEAVLARSYQALTAPHQARFRALGAFAPSASFRTEAAAAVWECEVGEAWRQLNAFADLGLLRRLDDEHDETRWDQHGLLRAYALALLREAGEEQAARARQAAGYLALMREADERQVYHRLLPDHPQLLHAFDWAIEHDPYLAGDLAGQAANLQAGFSLVPISHAWADRLMEVARKIGDDVVVGAAHFTVGNARLRLADLPDEDRPARLHQALAAYEAALAHYTPEAAPLNHAMTQNNKGNVLTSIADLPGEDRRARLYEALAANDASLRHRPFEVAPIGHARTLDSRAGILVALAELPDEDRPGRLLEALRCSWAAFLTFEQVRMPILAAEARATLGTVRRAAGESFERLWAELGAGEPPDWLGEDEPGGAAPAGSPV
jgi:hypothetical protein